MRRRGPARFFDGAPVPEPALKVALARAYFGQRARSRKHTTRVAAEVAPEWAGELGAE
jgi:hypothetical protein